MPPCSKPESWINIPQECDFPLHNIPFGIFKTSGSSRRAATIIGDTVVDLHALAELGFFRNLEIPRSIFATDSLNGFLALGRPAATTVRRRIIELFRSDNPELRDDSGAQGKVLTEKGRAELCMPVHIRNYTDFYSSIEHATNVGRMFRDPDNALLPNWKHLPVGYHGRASSIVVSGADVHRPLGQTKADDAAAPSFGPSDMVDFELELAFVTCKGTDVGQRIPAEEAAEHIFGFLLFNDWSARDIQKWEYVPLGPFLSKNFASSVSPWIVTLDALDPFRTRGPVQDPPVLPYLRCEGDRNYDIGLDVWIQPEGGAETKVCTTNFRHMYWNICQQLAHHTVNGCNIEAGDLYASGTVSGPEPGSYGSMLELTWKGTKPLKLADGSERKFLQDNDTVILRGRAEKDGIRVGFGEVRSKLLPAIV